ncbi:adhesion G protein-coupled receptor L4 isoform X2 [Cynocephalus volans]|uniref:adhesion G protein-coupled receptor L4 isoform X2 n=1 Tax=Cynocephalus volans TaxID=110931 RepID=UPI002FCC3393
MKLLPLLVGFSTLLNCFYTQNCTKKPCLPNAKCEIRDGVEACYCNMGYSGNGVTICKDDNECGNLTQSCGENANCTNTEGSYYCMCAPGFRSSSNQDKFITNDGTICIDIDECSESVVCGDHAVCENVNGGYNCSCKEGYQTSTGKSHFTPKDGTYCQENVNANCHLDNACTATNINKTLTKIRPIEEPMALLQEVYRNTLTDLSPVDIITYIEILAESSPLLAYVNNTISAKDTLSNSTLTEFVKTLNNFVQKDTFTVWDKLSANHRITHLTKLMHTAEQATLRISQNLQKTTQFDTNSSDIALKVFFFDSYHMKHIHPHMTVNGDYIKIFPKRKAAYDSDGNVAVAFLYYKSIGPLLSSSDNLLLEPQDYGNSEEEERVISSVISVSINSSPPTLYELEKVTFTLSHIKTIGKYRSLCAFWNYSPDTMNGRWSSEGCELTYSNETHTSCCCNHLTHFAILMSSDHSIGIKDYNILTRITQLGIIISVICLALCIFTFWFFSEIQSTRTTIHKNLCCSLFLAELVFLIGINTNTNKLFCSIIAGLLHYFFLAAFAWMCIEGIHLYLIVVGVIYNKGFLHKNFYIFGYLSPAVVVGFSAALGYRYYGTTKVCWLSTENNFIWSFIGPACLIILVLCKRSPCSPVPSWHHLDLWGSSCRARISGDSLPLHGQQRLPGDVYFLIPVCFIQKDPRRVL